MGTPHISARVLEKPAREVIRHSAKQLLKKSDEAVRRLRDRHDTEALHDSRVALRQLRGWFQAFRQELPLRHKWRRALKRLAHSTNRARDAEVCLLWVSRLTRRGHANERHFRAALEALRDESYRRVRKELPAKWRELARRLSHVAEAPAAPGSPFRRRFAASLQDFTREFERARVRARQDPSAPNIHALRIAGKKLRYLLEGVLKRDPAAKGLLDEIELLHDAAGTIQDLQRLQALMEEYFVTQADRGRKTPPEVSGSTRRADLEPSPESLLRIGGTARREQTTRITRFRRSYLGKSPPRYVMKLRQVMRQLREHGAKH